MGIRSRRADALALRLSRAYVFRRGSHYQLPAGFRPPVPGPERTRGSHWRRLVELCERAGIDALQYVHWSTQACYKSLPHELLNTKRMAAYRQELPLRCKEKELAWRCMWEYANVHVGWEAYAQAPAGPPERTERLVSRVLLMPSHDMTALFRFCCAYRLGDRRILDVWERGASLEYMGEREVFDVAWAAHIPAKFSARAERLYDRILESVRG